MPELQTICVFAGSSPGRRPEFRDAAAALGDGLARRGIRVVYGGGRVGLMGMLANAALEAGGKVIGVIPRQLLGAEAAHERLTELHVVESMHERKAMMAELADGFIALPGGFGTLEEFAEVTTWTQLGLHAKPTGLLNVAGYYDDLLAFFDGAVDDQLIRPEYRRLVLAHAELRPLLRAMQQWEVPGREQRLERVEET